MKNYIKNSKVAKNSMWIIADRIFQMIISLIIGSLTARYLGPTNYGIINYGASIIALFLSIAKLGLENIIIKEYVDNRNKNGEIIGTAMILRLCASFISILLIFILITILKPNEEIIIVVTMLQSLSLIFQSYEIIDYWFQSNLQSKYTSIAKSIAYTIVAIYKIVLLLLGKPVEWFALATTLDYFIIFIFLYIVYKKKSTQKLFFSKSILKGLLSKSYHFIISGMFVTLYMQMDKIMIGEFLGSSQVGLYSSAVTICTLWGFIPDALINSFRPVIYELKSKNEKEYANKLKLLYFIVFWLGIVFATIISIFSKLIINILFGSAYISAQVALMIAVWYTAFAYLGSARNIWFISENKIKYSKKCVIFGALSNLILNYILIPIYGINGAAVATLISQIIVALIAPLFYKEIRISTKIMLEGIFSKKILLKLKK